MRYDVVIIGGGPAGYPAAIRLAKLGYKVGLIEEDKIGGECTNYGCVPTKALGTIAHSLERLANAKLKIVYADDVIRSSLAFAREKASEVSESIERLLQHYGVDIIRGKAKVYSKENVEINGRKIAAKKGIVLATGSRPYASKMFHIDGKRVHDNKTILHWEPDASSSIAIIGGGYVGVEYSYILAMMGLRVTLIEALDRLLPGMDRDFGLLARRTLAKLGVSVFTNSSVDSVDITDNEIKIKIKNKLLSVDNLLIATGREPRNEEAKRLGLELDERGFVKIDACGRTNLQGVYAAGDLTGPPLLAHKAMRQSINIAECIAGDNPHELEPIPSVVFGPIDLVSVGLTLTQARKLGIKAIEVRVPSGGLAKSRIYGIREGFVKIVYEKNTRRIIGIHMAYVDASEVASTAAVIVGRKLTLEEASEIIFPHPTMSEAVSEALEAANNRAVHITGIRVRET